MPSNISLRTYSKNLSTLLLFLTATCSTVEASNHLSRLRARSLTILLPNKMLHSKKNPVLAKTPTPPNHEELERSRSQRETAELAMNNKDLTEENETLSTEYKELQGQISTYEDNVLNLEANIAELKEKNTLLNIQLSEFEQQTSQDDFKCLQSQQTENELKRVITSLMGDNNKLTAEYNNLLSRFHQLQNPSPSIHIQPIPQKNDFAIMMENNSEKLQAKIEELKTENNHLRIKNAQHAELTQQLSSELCSQTKELKNYDQPVTENVTFQDFSTLNSSDPIIKATPFRVRTIDTGDLETMDGVTLSQTSDTHSLQSNAFIYMGTPSSKDDASDNESEQHFQQLEQEKNELATANEQLEQEKNELKTANEQLEKQKIKFQIGCVLFSFPAMKLLYDIILPIWLSYNTSAPPISSHLPQGNEVNHRKKEIIPPDSCSFQREYMR